MVTQLFALRLAEHGIRTGWLLGESFGSQIVWEIVSAERFRAKGVILAGGFARHPFPWMASLAARLVGRSSFKLLTSAFRGYVRVSRARFRRSPETLACLDEFLARRAVQNLPYHRLRAVSENPWRDLEEGRYRALADTVVGDADAAFAAAAVQVDVEFQGPPQHQVPMELISSVVEWHGERLVIHEGTQNSSA